MPTLRQSHMDDCWIIDSNFFIHIGKLGHESIASDLQTLLNKINSKLIISKGIAKECSTVRFQNVKGKPLVFDSLESIIDQHEINSDEIQSLSVHMGESNSPQDVDVSLIVLAGKMKIEGKNPTIVSDDFKIKTSIESIGLEIKTIPPSTFTHSLSKIMNGESAIKCRTLSRKIRCSEMNYLIDRRNKFDLRPKLNWLIDSLTENQTKPIMINSTNSTSSKSLDMLSNVLVKSIHGFEIKQNHKNRLGDLPSICEGLLDLTNYLKEMSYFLQSGNSIDSKFIKKEYERGCAILSHFSQQLSPKLALLDSESRLIAHKAICPSVVEFESTLGLLCQMNSKFFESSLHLNRALIMSNIIKDVRVIISTMNRIGWLAIAQGEFEKSIILFESSLQLAIIEKNSLLKQYVSLAIAHTFLHKAKESSEFIDNARKEAEKDKLLASRELQQIGHMFLLLNQPGVAIELLDEAVECAVESNRTDLNRLLEELSYAEHIFSENDNEKVLALRKVLDKINHLPSKMNSKYEKTLAHSDKI